MSMRDGTAGTILALLTVSCTQEAAPNPPGPEPSGLSYHACSPLQFTPGDHYEQADISGNDNAYESHRANPGPGVALADFDGDGWLDVVLADTELHTTILLNDRTGHLEVANPRLDTGESLPLAGGVAVADLDGDGFLDIVMSRIIDNDDVVLYGKGNLEFSMVSLPDSEGGSKTVSIADVDGDTDLDLFISGFTDFVGPKADAGKLVGDGNRLYIQQDGSFVNETETRLPESIVGTLTYEGAWVDIDGDLDLDLYLVNDWGAVAGGNALLLNDGSGHFTLAQDCFCDLVILGMGAAIGDANGDAIPDMFLTDYGFNHLLVGLDDGSWVVATEAYGAVPVDDPGAPERGPSWGTVFVDANQDGWEDIAVAYGKGRDEDDVVQRDLLLINGGDGTFTDKSRTVGFADEDRGRAVAVGDLDRDGRPDLISTGEFFLKTWLAEGGCPPGVTLALDGPDHNRAGFGATVEVELEDRTYWRWMSPSATWSQSALELYLGLGGASRAERITVHWHDGTSTDYEGARAGTRRTIRWVDGQ